jgi:hypothetical protein
MTSQHWLIQGGWDAAGVYEPGWNAYAAFFDRVAKKLTGCSSGSSSGHKMIIGPGWDNVSGDLLHVTPAALNASAAPSYIPRTVLKFSARPSWLRLLAGPLVHNIVCALMPYRLYHLVPPYQGTLVRKERAKL